MRELIGTGKECEQGSKPRGMRQDPSGGSEFQNSLENFAKQYSPSACRLYFCRLRMTGVEMIDTDNSYFVFTLGFLFCTVELLDYLLTYIGHAFICFMFLSSPLVLW
jgi:hypothetical protein